MGGPSETAYSIAARLLDVTDTQVIKEVTIVLDRRI
jgi:hypothetical protein